MKQRALADPRLGIRQDLGGPRDFDPIRGSESLDRFVELLDHAFFFRSYRRMFFAHPGWLPCFLVGAGSGHVAGCGQSRLA